MLISDMIPYERNAWDNTEGVPAIAESIREFGFRGKIKLRSRENPVIVSGHHRVLALKQLGWSELPDENIEFCDDLTDAEVDAFRLADNETGQKGRWNRALKREEMRRLAAKVDMSRFGVDFASKAKPYGAERLRTDDHYNLRIVSILHTDGPEDMPTLEAVDFKPDKLIGFNYAKTAKGFDCGIHFFIDDYQFERLWNKPEQYLRLLKRFECVLTPDFSMYMDMPLPMQRWNEYRRRALGNYWQRNGMTVIPTLSWTDRRSFGFAFGGLPEGGTVAVSTVGIKGNDGAMKVWFEGMEAAIAAISPSCIVIYGGNIGFDFGDVETVEIKANTAFGR